MRRLLKIPVAPAVLICTVATITIAVHAGDDAPTSNQRESQGSSAGVEEPSTLTASNPDAGVEVPDDAGILEDTELAAKRSGAGKSTPREENAPPPIPWRKDPTVKRRPGSYLGGGMAYTLGNAWYHVDLREYEGDYHVGPLHGTGTFIRVGDAFFEWFAVGFHLLLISANNMGQAGDKAISGFALFLDPTFYPWRGLGLRPSVGLGFSYAQAGRGSHELGFGGPATLAFAVSYEFRISRLFVMGPVAQICWTTGKDFDAAFFSIGLQMLKWFMTPEG